MSRNIPLLGRFLSTAALASLIGGVLLSYQWGHGAGPSMAQVTPASPEMMQLVRDEHGLVATMLKAQLATEKKELAAAGTNRPGAAEAGTPLRATLAR
jgi:hypothetical protein